MDDSSSDIPLKQSGDGAEPSNMEEHVKLPPVQGVGVAPAAASTRKEVVVRGAPSSSPPSRTRGFTARETQQLYCNEEMKEFVDPTLFHRLVMPSAASIKRQQETAAWNDIESNKPKQLSGSSSGRQPPHQVSGKKRAAPDPSMKQSSLSSKASANAKSSSAAAAAMKKKLKAVVVGSPKLKSPPPGSVAAAASKQASRSSPTAFAVPPPYMYDWSSLELGTKFGSAAWNAKLREALHQQSLGRPQDTVPQLTSVEMLDILRVKCQLKTVLPPLNSPILAKLFRPTSSTPPQPADAAASVGDKTSNSDGDENGDEQDGSAGLVKTFVNVYETMIAQEAMGPNHYYTSSADDVEQLLRTLENDNARLSQRQERVLKLSKQVGLHTEETRINSLRLRGVIPADEADRIQMKNRGDSSSFWRSDFAQFLNDRNPGEAPFLQMHDQW